MAWGDDIRARFPDWLREAATLRWPDVRARLAVGQQVMGTVIARAPFGVWLDIGVGHPALLRVPEMQYARERRIGFDEYPTIGEIVEAWVIDLADCRAEISLSQRDRNPIPPAESSDR
jgi:ribosomal protein S1